MGVALVAEVVVVRIEVVFRTAMGPFPLELRSCFDANEQLLAATQLFEATLCSWREVLANEVGRERSDEIRKGDAIAGE